MKIPSFLKSILAGIFLTITVNGCSVNEERSSDNSVNKANQIVFSKSSNFNWNNKKVEVSFEDAFQKYAAIDNGTNTSNSLKYLLTNNNLKQGITVKLKLIDFYKKSEKINEIMIESYDLSKGINQFTIGYNDNKPYIIY